MAYEGSFRSAYPGQSPDSWSILGYEAVQLIARAMKESKSFLPQDTIKTMRNLKDIDLITARSAVGVMGSLPVIQCICAL